MINKYTMYNIKSLDRYFFFHVLSFLLFLSCSVIITYKYIAKNCSFGEYVLGIVLIGMVVFLLPHVKSLILKVSGSGAEVKMVIDRDQMKMTLEDSIYEEIPANIGDPKPFELSKEKRKKIQLLNKLMEELE